jgi:hypothetical protein
VNVVVGYTTNQKYRAREAKEKHFEARSLGHLESLHCEFIGKEGMNTLFLEPKSNSSKQEDNLLLCQFKTDSVDTPYFAGFTLFLTQTKQIIQQNITICVIKLFLMRIHRLLWTKSL